MCGAPSQTASLEGIDVAKETIVQGTVLRGGAPVPGAFVGLLDATGEFTAEVVTSPEGAFRFFASPGSWTVRALAPGATAETSVEAAQGVVSQTEILL